MKEYVWLVYNTSITSDPNHYGYTSLKSIHKTFEGAMKAKAWYVNWQKEFGQKNPGHRAFIRRKELKQ
jgi:hypothetical protein